jgi:Uma2 family endonuclease
LILLKVGGHVLENSLGRVYPGDVTFVLDGTPDDIRVQREPDVAFVSRKNVKPTKGYIYRAPDLAIEIVSPSQSYSEMTEKIDLYFRYGTKQVWLVLPDKKQIEVHFPDRKPEKYIVGQSVPGGEMLPGFSLEVSGLFEA